jgi:hypothetical protein
MTALRSDQVSDGHPQESSGPSVELSKEARGSQSGVDHEAQLDPIALPDKIPDGGYGWVVMSCIVGINAVTWGKSQRLLANKHLRMARTVLTDSIRRQHYVWSLLGVLPPKQLLRWRINIPLRLGRRSERSHRSDMRSFSKLPL